MNIKHIILLCLINYIATVHSNDDEEIIIEMDSPKSYVYSSNDVITWSKGLELVKINDPSKLLTAPDETFPNYVKKELAKRKWAPKLVTDLVANYKKINWPSGIKCEQLCNAEKERRIKNYKCRRVPGFLNDNREEAVIVLATDNLHLPADSIGHPGFLMLLNPGALHYTNLKDYSHVPHILDIVEITKWELLLTVADGSLSKSAEQLLLENQWPRRVVEAIVAKYDRYSWPSGISGTQIDNNETKKLIRTYKCRHIPSILSRNQEQAVIVFASDNDHMPADMIYKPGFLMIFKSGALPISGCLGNFSCPIL